MAHDRSRSTVLLLAMALATAGAARAGSPEFATLDRAAGKVTFIRNGEVKDAKVGMRLEPGDAIKTEEGTAQIKFPDKSQVRLCMGSQVEFSQPQPSQIDVHLSTGKLWASFAKTGSGQLLFRAGTTTATPARGTFLEMGFDADSGEVRLGVIEVSSEVAVGPAAPEHVPEHYMITVGADGKTEIGPFKEGDICPHEKTQCEYAAEIVRNVGLESELPANATEADSMALLASLGFAPCSGKWDCDMPLTLRDTKCILGLAADAPIFVIPLDEQVRLILEKCSECIFIQTKRRVPVSPFAP